MNQFKDVFLGKEARLQARRVVAEMRPRGRQAQRPRRGGQHRAPSHVLRDARQFLVRRLLQGRGDRFAWDLLVNEWKLDPERMWFTVFEGDDEVPADDEARGALGESRPKPDRILALGRKDNFWQMGETGPCGPNIEIHYYLGPHPETRNSTGANTSTAPATRRSRSGTSSSCSSTASKRLRGGHAGAAARALRRHRHGLERVTAVLQGVKSNYETDLIHPIIDFKAKLAGNTYGYDDSEDNVSMRVIADHARPGVPDRRRDLSRRTTRAVTCCARSCAAPSGTETSSGSKTSSSLKSPLRRRSVRRRLSRAARDPQRHRACGDDEEKRYALDGRRRAEVLEDVMKKTSRQSFPGADVFKLYDTYGLRYDLIEYVRSSAASRSTRKASMPS